MAGLGKILRGDGGGFAGAAVDQAASVTEALHVLDTTHPEALDWLRVQGVSGLGQSSWGPTGFAFAASEAEAKVVDGIEQEPMDGTSFLYTFDEPNAEDDDNSLTLQYQVSMGAHGAHKF